MLGTVARANLPGMEHKQTLHIVDTDTRARASLARTGFALGRHCEVYSSAGEFLRRPPENGLVLLTERPDGATAKELLDGLAKQGLWLPLAALSDRPDPGSVVAAMRAGALDYCALPADESALEPIVARLERNGATLRRGHLRMIGARSRIARLSQREREVLDWLSEGNSNKIIARELDISPRTVEIHRANMLVKLGARHSAEAIRMQVEAQLEPTVVSAPAMVSHGSDLRPALALVG